MLAGDGSFTSVGSEAAVGSQTMGYHAIHTHTESAWWDFSSVRVERGACPLIFIQPPWHPPVTISQTLLWIPANIYANLQFQCVHLPHLIHYIAVEIGCQAVTGKWMRWEPGNKVSHFILKRKERSVCLSNKNVIISLSATVYACRKIKDLIHTNSHLTSLSRVLRDKMITSL